MEEIPPLFSFRAAIQAPFISSWFIFMGPGLFGFWDPTGTVDVYDDKLVLKWGLMKRGIKEIPIKDIEYFQDYTALVGPLKIPQTAKEIAYKEGGMQKSIKLGVIPPSLARHISDRQKEN